MENFRTGNESSRVEHASARFDSLRNSSTQIYIRVISSNSTRYNFTNNSVQLVRFIALSSTHLFHGLKRHFLNLFFYI